LKSPDVVIVPPVAATNSAATAPLKLPIEICPEDGIGPATGEGVPGGTKPPPA
jgi:hypothetical protein